MSECKIVSLGSLASKSGDFVDGPFGSRMKASEYVDKGIPVIRLQNIRPNQYSSENLRFITNEKAQSLQRHNYQSGDVVITKLGEPCGVACQIPNNTKSGIIVADVVRFRGNSNVINHRYLVHFLNSQDGQRQVAVFTKGTTRKRINLSDIKKIQIPLPPIAEQKRIATILDKADTIRKKRQEAIKLTEELLRSQFLEMFGDPVTNPKKWPEKPLSEFIEIIIDYRGKTPKKSNKGIPLISAANIHNGKIDLTYEQYISEEDYKVWTTRGFTQAGDILITTEAPVGEIAPYPDSGVYQISRRVMALRPNTNKILSSFLLHTMLSKNWSQRLRKVTRGSTVPRVLKPDILGQMIPYAPMNLQHKFDCFVQRHKSLTQKQKSLPNQLDNLFNSLLQKAFKGEL